jgi:cellulose synthase operon protein YhjQ
MPLFSGGRDATEGRREPMGSVGTEIGEQETLTGTPDDVAALYSWANLHGAKYRDFSGSRREYRAQIRLRAAQELQERELKAQAVAEAAAAEAERDAQATEVHFQEVGEEHSRNEEQSLRSRFLEDAGSAGQRATAYRAEAIRHAETAAQLAVAVLREEREMADARASAQRQAQNYSESEPRLASRPLPGDTLTRLPILAFGAQGRSGTEGPSAEDPNAESFFALDLSRNAASLRGAHENEDVPLAVDGTGDVQLGPAWLYGAEPAPRQSETRTETLSRDTRTPLLAIFSFDGGVGKTGLVATLSRALGAQGERVVLADTTSHGLLPFYFGARELQSGVIRSFPATSGAVAEPLSLVSYDLSETRQGEAEREALVDEILRNAEGSDRIVLDISSGSNWLVRRIADLRPIVLVPLALEMNSAIAAQAVERLFRGIADSAGNPLQPYYVLNQFDPSVPLHLEIRESLRRQLRDRLLPFSIRRSPAVNEALAEGMTVVDFASESPVAQDYIEVATWLRSVSPSTIEETLAARWSAP